MYYKYNIYIMYTIYINILYYILLLVTIVTTIRLYHCDYYTIATCHAFLLVITTTIR